MLTKSRLNAGRIASPGAEYYVAMENGIVETEANLWVDVCWMVLHHVRSGKEYMSVSQGVVLPTDAVEEARAAGFHQRTVGDVLAGT